MVKVVQNYGITVLSTADSWWLQGDFSYDGMVGFDDLVMVAQNYGKSAIPASAQFSAAFAADWTAAQELANVPEPTLAALVGVALLLVRTRGTIRQMPVSSASGFCEGCLVSGRIPLHFEMGSRA